MPDVVVVGAGIAGLSAARALSAAGCTVTVLEGADQAGGKLRTSAIAGLDVDEGAEAFLVRVPEAAALCAEVGLEVVHPVTASASVLARGRLRPLPAGTLMGVPTSARSVLESGILGPLGLARAAADLVLPGAPVADDVAVGRYVGDRVGRQVVDRLVDPLLGGVYAGRADELSMAATVPQLLAVAQSSRSLLLGAHRARVAPSAAPVFGSVAGGMGRLVAALTKDLDLRLATPVTSVQRRGSGWVVTAGSTREPATFSADAVVVAVPGQPARRLLSAYAEVPELAYASVAVTALAFPRSAVPESLKGSGFLVPSDPHRLVKGVTFSSLKWGHLMDPDVFVLRASAGRAGEEAAIQRDDVELAGVVAAEVAALTGIRARPLEWRVTRWGGGLPQYPPGHVERVQRVRGALPAGLAVAGAAWDGVGIPASIRSGRAAATDLVRHLGVGADNR